MDVTVIGVAADPGRVGDIRQVDEDGTRTALVVARLRSDRKEQVLLLIDDDVVAATRARQVGEVSGHVSEGIVVDRLGGVNIEQLGGACVLILLRFAR